MSLIKYFVLPDEKDKIGGNVAEPNGFADALINPQKDEELRAFCEKNRVDYGNQCEKLNTFAWNGATYYCSAKTAQAVEKKFKILKIITDRDQLKQIREEEKETKQEMRSDEWLYNKIIQDCGRLFGEGSSKRYRFIQQIRDCNPEIAHARMTRQIQKLFEEQLLIINEKNVVSPGTQFPQDTIVSNKLVEKKDLYGRVKKVKND